jgi:hypothetical protein
MFFISIRAIFLPQKPPWQSKQLTMVIFDVALQFSEEATYKEMALMSNKYQ